MSEQRAAEATDVRRPNTNVVLILADDMGFADLGCYGSEIETPNLDRLASHGIRLSQFYNTARCSPSRASLLTGLHPHVTGVGILTDDDRPYGYPGTLDRNCLTLAEVLGDAGYATYMSGKWHLTNSMHRLDDTWPTRRGFQRFFGTIAGGGSYFWPPTLVRDEAPVPQSDLPDDWYYTDAIGQAAVEFIEQHQPGRPFFLYTAFTAPHWPLHAPPELIEQQGSRYLAGWDRLRAQRISRQRELGLIGSEWAPSERDSRVGAWDDCTEKQWEARRMAVYAAQVARMDHNIGRIVEALERAGQLEDTILIFLSDNGGCAEGQPYGLIADLPWIRPSLHATTRDGRLVMRGNRPDLMPGDEVTYASYGVAWANMSNAPFREYKHWVHEGGIATPFIVHWPAGELAGGEIYHQPFQLPDVMATLLDATGLAYPADYQGRSPIQPQGQTMLPTWRGDGAAPHDLFWEHEGNAAVRRGRWKLVRKFPGPWELYNLHVDRAELTDRSHEEPDLVRDLSAAWERWAAEWGVIPRERILDSWERQGRHVSPDAGVSALVTDGPGWR